MLLLLGVFASRLMHNGQKEFEIFNGNGYVKEFDSNGKLKYEGEYLNGKKHGKGKKYD